MKEKWKKVQNYGSYSVSSYGNVRNDETGTIRKQNKNGSGYLCVTIWRDGTPRTLVVHRLVANAFLKNPHNKPCINHKDGDRTNNNIHNLEWCTAKENSLHRYRVLGNYISKESASKISAWRRKPVLCVETNVVYESVAAAARTMECTDGAIRAVIKGRRPRAKGYTWEFVQESESSTD